MNVDAASRREGGTSSVDGYWTAVGALLRPRRYAEATFTVSDPPRARTQWVFPQRRALFWFGLLPRGAGARRIWWRVAQRWRFAAQSVRPEPELENRAKRGDAAADGVH